MSRRGPLRSIVLGGLLMVVLGKHEASAQAIDQYFAPPGASIGGTPNDPSQALASSDYESQGVRVGSFVVRPQLSEGLGYNSNVDGVAGGKGSVESDTNVSVLARSDWARNSVYAGLTLDEQVFPQRGVEDETNWTASLGGTLTVGRDVIGATYSHLNLTQAPGTLDAITTVQPVVYQVDTAALSYTASSFGRFVFVPTVQVSSYNFDNTLVPGQTFGESYRDRAVLQGGLTTRYELAEDRTLLLVVTGTHISYTTSVANLPNRDSNGVQVLAGVDFAPTGANLRFRILGGYQIRNYRDPIFPSIAAPILEASVIWTPTRLTTVTLTARRDIQDSADENVGGYTYTAGRLNVDHELRRNVKLNAFADLQRADYQPVNGLPAQASVLQSGSTQTIYSVGAGATWLLNRNTRLSATYQFSDRQGVPVNTYNAQIALITLGFQL
jgi:hypothetical protein